MRNSQGRGGGGGLVRNTEVRNEDNYEGKEDYEYQENSTNIYLLYEL